MSPPWPAEAACDRPPVLVSATASAAFFVVLVATGLSLMRGALDPFPLFMAASALVGLAAVLVRARSGVLRHRSGLVVVALVLLVQAAVLAFGWVSLWDLRSPWARVAIVLLAAVAWFGLTATVKAGEARRRAVWLFSLASLAVVLLAFMAVPLGTGDLTSLPAAALFTALLALAWGVSLPAIAAAPSPSLLPTVYWCAVGAIGIGCLATSLLAALVYAPFFVVLAIVGIAWTLPCLA